MRGVEEHDSETDAQEKYRHTQKGTDRHRQRRTETQRRNQNQEAQHSSLHPKQTPASSIPTTNLSFGVSALQRRAATLRSCRTCSVFAEALVGQVGDSEVSGPWAVVLGALWKGRCSLLSLPATSKIDLLDGPAEKIIRSSPLR